MKTLIDYFEDLETTREYDGYFCSVADAITIVILGSICGLKNVSQIHQWATNEKIKKFLKEKFQIEKVPCYYWLLCLLKIVKPDSLNKCFVRWVESQIPDKSKEYTVAVDGKTIRSTTKMSGCGNILHIISVYISELGMMLVQKG